MPPSLQKPASGPFFMVMWPLTRLIRGDKASGLALLNEETLPIIIGTACHNPVLVNNAPVTKCADERAK